MCTARHPGFFAPGYQRPIVTYELSHSPATIRLVPSPSLERWRIRDVLLLLPVRRDTRHLPKDRPHRIPPSHPMLPHPPAPSRTIDAIARAVVEDRGILRKELHLSPLPPPGHAVPGQPSTEEPRPEVLVESRPRKGRGSVLHPASQRPGRVTLASTTRTLVSCAREIARFRSTVVVPASGATAVKCNTCEVASGSCLRISFRRERYSILTGCSGK